MADQDSRTFQALRIGGVSFESWKSQETDPFSMYLRTEEGSVSKRKGVSKAMLKEEASKKRSNMKGHLLSWALRFSKQSCFNETVGSHTAIHSKLSMNELGIHITIGSSRRPVLQGFTDVRIVMTRLLCCLQSCCYRSCLRRHQSQGSDHFLLYVYGSFQFWQTKQWDDGNNSKEQKVACI